MSVAAYLKVAEAVELANVSAHLIRKAIREGYLQAYRPGGLIRIKRKDLIEWLEALEYEGVDPSRVRGGGRPPKQVKVGRRKRVARA